MKTDTTKSTADAAEGAERAVLQMTEGESYRILMHGRLDATLGEYLSALGASTD